MSDFLWLRKVLSDQLAMIVKLQVLFDASEVITKNGRKVIHIKDLCMNYGLSIKLKQGVQSCFK